MTVSSTVRTAGPYPGTGAVSSFPFAFKVFDTTDVAVQVTTATVLEDLVYGADYTVTLNADQDGDPGGWVTLSSALAIGSSLVIGSALVLEQPTHITNAGGFLPEVVEHGLDRAIILIQQSLTSIRGAIRVPEIGGVPTVPAAAQRANMLLSFDGAGNPSTVAPVAGTATALALQLASSAGAGGVGILDAADVYTGTTVEAALAQVGKDVRGRLRDVRTFAGIVADGVTDDFLALQAAVISARDGGYGIFWPKGVKTFVQFSTLHPYLFVDGPVHWEAADRFTSGIIVHCNYEMTGHAPLFCWGIPSKGANVNKVSGHVRNLGFWLKAGSQRFERMCHLYGFTDFTVSECFCDMRAVTWPAADGGHVNGYQAGGWWSSNLQPSFAANQTRDENFRFLHNVGYASAEYQNSESVGISNCYIVEMAGNRLEGWSDDMAAHACTAVSIAGNHMKTVAGRYFVQNSRHVVVRHNHIEPIPRPLVGGYLGTTRTYIGVDMSSRVQAIVDDVPNANVTISENTIYLPSGCYANPAIACYGVQDGLFVEDNVIFNDGATSPTSVVLVSTSFRAGWTGPVGNPDYAAGGAVRLRSFRIEDNLELGAGWASNEGGISTAVYAGGASSDILGPGFVDRNTAGSYTILHEPIVFGEHNRALPVSASPYQSVSAVCMVRHPRAYTAPLTAPQQLEGTHHPVGSPQSVLDAYGLAFAAPQDGSVRGVMLTLTSGTALVAGNACTVRILKNGSQLGSDTATTSLATANTFRYLVNFSGAAMPFAKGDSITIQLSFDVGQVTAIVGKAELMVLYE